MPCWKGTCQIRTKAGSAAGQFSRAASIGARQTLGRDRALAQSGYHVLDRQPDIIILADFLTDDPYEDEEAYGELKSTLIPARVDMLDNPRLWSEYDPRSVQIEEGRWFNMLVRRQPVAVRSAATPP